VWVSFGYVGGQLVIASARNVASVVRTAAGRYRVHFAVAMPDANYCWTALARSSVDTGQQRIAVVRATADAKTAHYVDISCTTAASSFADSSEINLVVYR
jgi:CelD/BcsL family acetyltransferase involved in cellulose biosynthesis